MLAFQIIGLTSGENGYVHNWSGASAACKDGFKVPSKEDFQDVVSVKKYLDVAALKFENWGGTDQFSWKALPAGRYVSKADASIRNTDYAFWWTSTPTSTSGFMNVVRMGSGIDYLTSIDTAQYVGVRCLMKKWGE